MGTKERRQREFEDREQVFLDCARDLIRDEGLLNLQMSRIAEKSEYAVGTLYKHFASKEDLLLALAAVDTEKHVAMFQRATQWQAKARDRMVAIAVADMIFVRRNPDFFRLGQYVFTEVVWKAASTERRQAMLVASDPLADVVVGIVNDGVAAGELELRGMAAEEICTGLWALSAGTHNLVHAEGVLEDFNIRDPYRLMCRHTQVMLNGYGWRPLVDVSDGAALDALIKRICNEVFDDLCSE